MYRFTEELYTWDVLDINLNFLAFLWKITLPAIRIFYTRGVSVYFLSLKQIKEQKKMLDR